jgi:hypothetical protein
LGEVSIPGTGKDYTVEVKGHLLPYESEKYDIGTEKDLTSITGAAKRWRDAYFSGTVKCQSLMP